MPLVIVPPPYRGPTSGQAELKVGDGTVRACLEEVERTHPGFLAQVLSGTGALHRFVRLFLNEQPLSEDELDTPVAGDDRLEIVAAIAGG